MCCYSMCKSTKLTVLKMSVCHGFVKTYSMADMFEEIFMIDYFDLQGLETQHYISTYLISGLAWQGRFLVSSYASGMSIILQLYSFGKRVVAAKLAASMRISGIIAPFFL